MLATDRCVWGNVGGEFSCKKEAECVVNKVTCEGCIGAFERTPKLNYEVKIVKGWIALRCIHGTGMNVIVDEWRYQYCMEGDVLNTPDMFSIEGDEAGYTF